MAFEIIKEIFEREHPGLTSADLAVLVAVGYHADLSTRKAWPSNALLASETGFSRSAVGKAVSHLISMGYLRSQVLANYRRIVTITGPDDWARATPRSEGVSTREEGVTPTEEGVSHSDEGGCSQGVGGYSQERENQSITSHENQSENQSGTSGDFVAAEGPRVKRISLGQEGEVLAKQLPTLLQQKIEAACEEYEVRPKKLDRLDPVMLRSRFNQIMRRYSVTPAEIVWMLDWFVLKTVQRWDELTHHPGQWFITDREIQSLVEVLRNKQAEADVEDTDEGVNC